MASSPAAPDPSASLPDEPVLDPAAPWLGRWRAAAARNEGDRLVQVATVSPAGEPEVRTVVLRGLARDGRPTFVGDARAAKHVALEAGSALELCVWWSGSGEQFRLRGPVLAVTTDDSPWAGRRRELWRAQGPEGRARFLGPAPGSPQPAPGAAAPAEAPADPPPSFALYVLEPRRVERLELTAGPARELHVLEPSGWRGGPVAP